MPELTRRFHLPSAVRSSPLRISAAQAHSLIDAGAVIIDVRRQDDDSAAIEGSLRVPPDAIPRLLGEFRRDVPIVLGCT